MGTGVIRPRCISRTEKSMHIAVVGAGAVGCYYGGLLLQAGHAVTFIGRQPHVDAINAHGRECQIFCVRGLCEG
jgi:2-polyprenyl-6-methoxyphenol hydroxylase-like FAD-dependent oxidoreductase